MSAPDQSRPAGRRTSWSASGWSVLAVVLVPLLGAIGLMAGSQVADAAPLPSAVATANPPAWGWNCPPGVTPPSSACTYYSSSAGTVSTPSSAAGSALPHSVSAGLGPISTPPWPGTGGGLALAAGLPLLAGAALLLRRRHAPILPGPVSALRPIRRWAAAGRTLTARQRAAAGGLAVIFALTPLAATSISHLRLWSALADSGTVPSGLTVTGLPAAGGVAEGGGPGVGAPGVARPDVGGPGVARPDVGGPGVGGPGVGGPSAQTASGHTGAVGVNPGGLRADGPAVGSPAVAAPGAGVSVGGSPPVGASSAVSPAPVSSAPAAGAVAGVAPVHITIPSLGVDTAVDPETVDASGSLGVPRNPATVGWWSSGPAPGSPVGTAVLDSHVNYGGQQGAFAHLSDLAPGAIISLSAAGTTERFVVTGTREYSKGALPWGSIFSSQVQGRLALVTCGGAFDTATGHYMDNVVAFAVPLT